MVNSIVQVNVSIQVAPTPSTLQASGAAVSQGGTTLSLGTFAFLTQLADLTPLLQQPVNLASLAWSSSGGGTVTGTTGTAIGLAIGDQFTTTIAGAVPAILNGTYVATVTGAKTFQFSFANNPGSITTNGSYTPNNVAELVAMMTTFFGQGANQGIYVLELGAGEVAAAVGNLQTFINNNTPQVFYSYLVPRTWDADPTFMPFIAQFENNTAKTYFYVTTTLQNYPQYTALMKDVIAMIECPKFGVWPATAVASVSWSNGQATVNFATTPGVSGILPGQSFQLVGMTPTAYNGWWTALNGSSGTTAIIKGPNIAVNPGAVTVPGTLLASLYLSGGVPLAFEFSLASVIHTTLSYAPSAVNKVTPLSFAFLFGVTPFPTQGLAAVLSALKTANINIVGTGSEGGISNTILFWGHTLDGNQFNFWYSVDWVQINLDLNVANAVINGSNNPANPLYYDQPGINWLQHVGASTLANAIAFGMAIGTVTQTSLDGPGLATALDAGVFANQAVINAVPFIIYTTQLPGDYKIGRYAGFTAIYIPARGFEAIIFNLIVSQFVAL